MLGVTNNKKYVMPKGGVIVWKLQNDINTRLSLVHSRLVALEKEQKELTAEKDYLEGLAKLYDNREYDSIEEERRVTEHLLEKSKVGDVAPRKMYTKISKYTPYLTQIFADGETKEFNDIWAQLETLIGTKLNYKNFGYILSTQAKAGVITRVGKGYYTINK